MRDQNPVPSDEPRIVVVGAGVIGLTCAIELATAGRSVRIVTDRAPSETTSAAAGAMLGITGLDPDATESRWAATATERFLLLAGEPSSGVRLLSGRCTTTFADEPPPWALSLPDFRPCRADELGGMSAGFWATLPFAEMDRYLRFLARRAAALKIPISRATVVSLDELGEADVVVNCTGSSARELVPDPAVSPVWGMHVVLDNPGIDEFVMQAVPDPDWVNYFPYGDRVLVGGVARSEPPAAGEIDEIAEQILRRATLVEPRLAEAIGYDVVQGLRPVRPEPRVELDQDHPVPVVHAYGHGGLGVAVSWGVAEDVVRLTGEALG